MFQRSLADHKRRMAKLPGNTNFFCDLKCNAKHRNKTAINTNRLKPQFGNKNGQKYPEGIGWYVGRCARDNRNCVLTENRNNFAQHLVEIWNKQNGKCAITGQPLERKNSIGKCSTENPFLIASLDRIDNKKGYETGNVQWVCLAINLARKDLPLEKFIDFYKKFIQ